MDDDDFLDAAFTDVLDVPAITIADEDRALRRIIEHARRRTRRRRLTSAAVALMLFVTVGITIVVAGSRHTAEVRVQTTTPQPPTPKVSDVLVFNATDGVLTVDPTTHTATQHPIAGWRPGDQPFLSLRVENDLVVGWGDVYAAPLAGGPSHRLGTGVFVPATEPGAVWLTSYGKVQTPTERLVDMHGHVLMQVRAPHEPGSANSVPARTGVPDGLALEANNGLDILDARTGRITKHLGTTAATAAPAFGSLLAWCDHCDRTLDITDLRTGTTRSIPLALNGGFVDLHSFVFSPDGNQLALPVQPDGAAPTGATTKIITLNVSTGQVITTIDTHARYASIAWSPDSRRIYIAATNSGNGGEILVHDPKTNTTLDLGPAPGSAGQLSVVVTHNDATLLPTSNTNPTTSAVVGTLREVGGPAPGLNRQIPGTVTAISTSAQHWQTTTTATRPFSLTLPVGTYRFTGTSPLINSGQSQCFAPNPIVVVPGKTTNVEVVCSIR